MLGECSDDLVIRVTDLCEHPGLIHPNEGTCGISQYQAFSARSVCASEFGDVLSLALTFQNDAAPVEKLPWAIISPYSELPNSKCTWGGACFMKKQTEAHIDQIVAMCDGDLRGALKALMLVNEHLEAQLERLHATNGLDENNVRRMSSLH
jgi:hypothetical protein